MSAEIAQLVPLEVESKPDPRDDFVLTNLRIEFERMAVMRTQASAHLSNLRTAIVSAENSVSLANSHLEQCREYITNRCDQLKIPVPLMYHARDCDCTDCCPFDEGEEHA